MGMLEVATGMINKIQYGTILIAEGNLTNTKTIDAVVVAKTALLHLGQKGQDGYVMNSDDFFNWVALTNLTTVTATRLGTERTSQASFAAIEFKGGIKSIQAGVVICDAATAYATITAVDVAKSIVLSRGEVSSNVTGINSEIFGHITLTSATRVTALRSGTAAVTYFYFNVVEFA